MTINNLWYISNKLVTKNVFYFIQIGDFKLKRA
jgi:hypothetical protein